MFHASFRSACLLVFIGQALSTVAQSSSGSDDSWPPEYYQPISPSPPELGFTYNHASTATEGQLRGESAVVHAWGNYHLNVEQAHICREQARAIGLGNQRRWVEYRIAQRAWHEHNRQRRAAAARKVNESQRATTFAVYRLDCQQLDRSTGAIAWPVALQASTYDSLRERLETLFRVRAGYGSPSATNTQEILRWASNFVAEVRHHRTTVDRDEYLAVQRFLCGLKYEPLLTSREDSTRLPALAELQSPRRTTPSDTPPAPPLALTSLN